MGLTKVYLTVVSTLMIFHFCAGANLRLKRSEGGTDSNLDPNGRCITARNWKQECNDCWCVENGLPACTLKGCIQAPVQTKPQTEGNSANLEKCVPGSQWKEDCNSCWCTDNGLSICTKIGCVRL